MNPMCMMIHAFLILITFTKAITTPTRPTLVMVTMNYIKILEDVQFQTEFTNLQLTRESIKNMFGLYMLVTVRTAI